MDAEGAFCSYVKPKSSTKFKYHVLFDISQKHLVNKVVLDALPLLFNTPRRGAAGGGKSPPARLRRAG